MKVHKCNPIPNQEEPTQCLPWHMCIHVNYTTGRATGVHDVETVGSNALEIMKVLLIDNLNLKTYLADVSIGCSNLPQGEM